MMTLNVVRSIFPAFRGYSQVCVNIALFKCFIHTRSQALIVDEVCSH
jgi:hypothetical protein